MLPRKFRRSIGGWKNKIGDFFNLKKKVKDKKFWFKFFKIVLIFIGAGFIFSFILFAWYSKDLPSPTKVVRRDGFSTKIYDRNDELLYDVFSNEKRSPVGWDEIPDYLKQATIAVEDKDFYNHRGFDPLTPFRIIKNLFYFGKITGGSTLTQQLTKNVLLTSERLVTRKIKELILSIQIDAKYSKDEVLLMYLNEAPYGGTSWGVGSAVEQYFDKEVDELNLAESAILAGLPQLPSIYSPYSKTPEAYIERTEHVLERMVDDGYISRDLKDKAMEEVKDYEFDGNGANITAPHFVLWIKDQLIEKYGEEVVEGGGLKVTTSLDLELQQEAEEIVAEEIDSAEKLGISNGAAIMVDPTNGQILAMVGSRDYFSEDTDGNFNVVTQALRQPGSAIKPVTYLTGLQKGWTAGSFIMDTPVTFKGVGGQKDYSPNNYSGEFNGPMTLRTALGNSINTTAVKMLANVGIENMLSVAYDMGLSTLEPTKENLSRFGLALTLGGAEVKIIELAGAYSAFANGGQKAELTGILKVENVSGRVLEEFKKPAIKEVMTPQEAFIISHILSDNSARELTFGAVNGLQISGYQVAVKTGTTNDKRDNWAIGWTPNFLTAVWVGNNDNSPMKQVASGVSGATPIWRKIMNYSLPKRNKEDFPIPDKIVNVEVDRVSGFLAHDGFSSRSEYLIDGTQPSGPDPIHMKLKVCKDQRGLATIEDVANGNYDEKEYFRFKEEDFISTDGINRLQEGIDGWIEEQADKDKYNPPEDYCHSGGMVNVGIDNPGNHSTVGNSFDIRVTTNSIKKIVEVKLWIDDEEKKVWTERPFEMTVNLEDGPHIIKVKATDRDGDNQERESYFGVNTAWDEDPSPSEAEEEISPSPSEAEEED
jgi:penicillin-binding protein 1C